MHRIIMILAVAVSSALAQFVCPDMFGMFRHPDNCSIFFICNYGMAHERACPPNLLFDTDLGICRHSSDVQCLHQTQLLTAGFTCSSSVGLFADPFSCEHFYLCANGHPYRQRCPFGLIFDGVVCNWKYDRSCLFQDRLWLGESAENQVREQPKDPRRPSKIDIKKMPKISTQRIPDSSVPYSTPDEMTISVNDLKIEESEYGRPGKIPTVTPVGRDISRTEIRPKVVSMLENKKGDNSTKPHESLQDTTQNLEGTENEKQRQLKKQSPKVQSRWKELQRQQQRRQQQQWMMQRQRQWRLQQRWTRQQQWRLRQDQRKLHERQQQRKLQQEQRKQLEQQRMLQEQHQGNATVNESFNQTRLMAEKVTTKPDLISHRPIGKEKISRRWWRTSWRHRLPRSEKTTSSPWLFPVRHKTQSPAIVAIQAFGLKKSVNNSKEISTNNISSNSSNFDKNHTRKDHSENRENSSSNNFIKHNKDIDPNDNSIDNDRNTGGNNISNIYNNAHINSNLTTDTNNANNSNTNTDNDNNNHNNINNDNNIITDGNKIFNSTHVINNVTDNTSNTNNSYIRNNINVTIDIDYKATNNNLTTNSLMNNINTVIFNSSNNNDINIRNDTLSGRVSNSTTGAMFVFRTSKNPDKKSDFSKPFAKKDATEKLTTQNFSAS